MSLPSYSNIGKIPKQVQLGHPALLNRAVEVSPDPKTCALLAEGLERALKRSTGIGLALPQLGLGLRGFVIDASLFQPARYRFCFNPAIVRNSVETSVKEEGCLSLPGEHHYVSRFNDIEVVYINQKGQEVREKMFGWTARCFQHELDHLDGIMINSEKRSVPKPVEPPRPKHLLPLVVGAATAMGLSAQLDSLKPADPVVLNPEDESPLKLLRELEDHVHDVMGLPAEFMKKNA